MHMRSRIQQILRLWYPRVMAKTCTIVWNQNFNCAAHKHNIFYMNLKKKIKLELAIIWKQVPRQRITSKKHSASMGRHLSPRFAQVVLVSGYLVLTAVNWSHFLCSDPKLAKKYEIEYCLRSSKTINWSADSFQINYVTSMSWQMSPRYGHGILVSGYPVLTAVNWLYSECHI